MKSLLSLFILLLLTTPLFPQQPTFSWGPPIERDPQELTNMHVIGTSGDSFYAVYEENGQATLERYDANHQRLWATALLPKTTGGQTADFYDVLFLSDKLFLLSTFTTRGITTVYAQEITPSGNYRPTIRTVTSARTNSELSVAVSDNNSSVLMVLADNSSNRVTASLFNANLNPRWTQTFSSRSTFEQATVLQDGTSFILSQASPTAPSTASYILHRLDSRNGKPEETAIGHPQYRLMQTQMATRANDLHLAGYYVPATATSALGPEPAGTFYYRFSSAKSKKTVTAFTPFDAAFTNAFRSSKPDYDRSKRMRNLQLKKVLPAASGGAIVLGEIAFEELENGSRTYNNNDVIIVKLQPDGTAAYTTSASKLQRSQNDDGRSNSFSTLTRQDTLYLLYQDVEYSLASQSEGNVAAVQSGTTFPVVVKIFPDGKQEEITLRNSLPARAPAFRLRPSTTYPASPHRIIVLGAGPGFYRYGSLIL